MKKTFCLQPLLAALLIATMTAACASADAGQETVLVMKPVLFGSGGVDPSPLRAGQVTLTAPTTSAVAVNVQPVTFDAAFADVPSKDGVPIDFNAQVRVQITDSPRLVNDFTATGDVAAFYRDHVAKSFEDAVRRTINKYTEERGGDVEVAILPGGWWRHRLELEPISAPPCPPHDWTKTLTVWPG